MARKQAEAPRPVEPVAGLTDAEAAELADLEKRASNRNGDVPSHKMLRLSALRGKAKALKPEAPAE